jgi:hypothetical protein
MFYGKAEETYPSKGAVYCPPLPFNIPINLKKGERVKVLLMECTLGCCQGDSQSCQYILYTRPEFESVRHPSQLSGRFPLRTLLIHEPVCPDTFSARCLSLFLLTVDQTPRAFSGVVTSPCAMFAVEPPGSGISIGVVGCSA